ncbi:MAG: methyltransferase domain-containing protein [Alphaproteobacteria bacterium]|nr:methyltransferase domain-containing protein [Alphaproteobacteria bacterium]
MRIPDITGYGQYKRDVFSKLGLDFQPGMSILDIGCGDGTDAEIFMKEFRLKTVAVDVYEHPRIREIENIEFQIASVLDLPFSDDSYDYVFLHDVLHHIDEQEQSRKLHLAALREVERVVAHSGMVVIVEANRYNPISYFHMVKRLGHDHWTQSYFKNVVRNVFPLAHFRTFEAHAYPWGYPMWRVYEYFMERVAPSAIHSYNVAVIPSNESS